MQKEQIEQTHSTNWHSSPGIVKRWSTGAYSREVGPKARQGQSMLKIQN